MTMLQASTLEPIVKRAVQMLVATWERAGEESLGDHDGGLSTEKATAELKDSMLAMVRRATGERAREAGGRREDDERVVRHKEVGFTRGG